MTRPITLEDVANAPRQNWAVPGGLGLAFRPDDRLITYLHNPQGGLVRQLYAFDPSTGERRVLITPPGGGATEENLSLEEKLRRERQRQHDLGVTSYEWAPAQDRLLAPFPDGLYVQEGSAALRKLVDSSSGPLLDPQFSPDGEWIAFVQASELWVVPFAGGTPRQITHDAAARGLTHGLAEYIAQEEMGRSHGFWWSADSQRLAFEEVDETHIAVYRIVHQGKDSTGEGAQEDHRYPFAGQPNARVRLGVVERSGGDPVWMDLGPESDIYLARVDWLPDGDLAVQVENRAQTRLDLLRFDPRTGISTHLLSEESDIWINLHDILYPIRSGPYAGGFLWASERTGYRHLYLYSGKGELLHTLTSGDWVVDSLAGVDEQNGLVYFTATRNSPLESHLYVVPLAPAPANSKTAERCMQVTQAPGMHLVVLDHACQRFIDIHNAVDTPPHVDLRLLGDGSLITPILDLDHPLTRELDLQPPELVTLTSRDGETLYGAIYRPATGAPPYATIVSVYGGPHAQTVINSWRMTTSLRAQYLRQQGFLVFMLDNRGSARRGLAFEGALRYNMGDIEVRDQVDGVNWLVQQGLADPNRVGIYGWSYGGYMAAMCLMRAPKTFRAAVAGAPVTHWDGYDTHYTERYMGTPQTNPEGYAASAVMRYAGQLQGRLMLVHGLIDENVHFRHTARLINALIQSRKTYDLLLFPDERHSPRRAADRVYMEQQIVAFFERELGNAKA